MTTNLAGRRNNCRIMSVLLADVRPILDSDAKADKALQLR